MSSVRERSGAVVSLSALRVNGYDAAYYTTLVKSVGKELAAVSRAPHLPFGFIVTNGWENNAWCLPGGAVFFDASLVDDLHKATRSFDVGCFSLEEKTAAVLAHEIAHATFRHPEKQERFSKAFLVAGIVAGCAACFFLSLSIPLVAVGVGIQYCLILLVDGMVAVYAVYFMAKMWFSRQHELEADKESIRMLSRAGYDPKVTIWLQKLFASENGGRDISVGDHFLRLFMTHPDPAQRAEINAKTIADSLPRVERESNTLLQNVI